MRATGVLLLLLVSALSGCSTVYTSCDEAVLSLVDLSEDAFAYGFLEEGCQAQTDCDSLCAEVYEDLGYSYEVGDCLATYSKTARDDETAKKYLGYVLVRDNRIVATSLEEVE